MALKNTLNIAFLQLYTDKPPYSGPLRPFVVFTKYLRNSVLILYKPKYSIIEDYRRYLNEKVIVFKELNELIKYLKENKVDFVVATDFYKSLLFLKKLRRYWTAHSSIVIYAEVYHGTLNPHSIRSRVIFRILSSLLREYRYIIANSITGCKLLINYYNVKPVGYVYPPVDTKIFKPREKPSASEGLHKVLLYVGSMSKDTSFKVIEHILEALLSRDDIELIYLLGATCIQQKLMRIFKSNKVRPLINISDEELAKIYSSVSLTICPQKWEPYGYVIAESIACRTPVIALNSMGPKELIYLSKCGLLVDSEEDMPNFIKYLDFKTLRNIVCTNSNVVSPETSINKLIKILKISRLDMFTQGGILHWKK